MMNDLVIEAKHLHCKAGYRFLLNDINWQVKAGERWAVFGMNGCGKTTLLSIIAGFKDPTGGMLKIFGEEYSNDNILAMRQRIGWVSGSFFDKCYTRESALDIVLSGKSGALGLSEGLTLKDQILARELLEELNLKECVNRTFDMLSKGERQNVLIARALFSQPEILVLDEPCTALDIYNREYLFNTLDNLAKNKRITIIYVTHYAEEIMPIFDNCLLLKRGKIFAQGATKDLFNDTTISELLGYPVKIETNQKGTYDVKVLNVCSNAAKFLASAERRDEK